jgi:hypothetical protein
MFGPELTLQRLKSVGDNRVEIRIRAGLRHQGDTRDAERDAHVKIVAAAFAAVGLRQHHATVNDVWLKPPEPREFVFHIGRNVQNAFDIFKNKLQFCSHLHSSW